MKGLCLKCCLTFILAIGVLCGTIYAQPITPDVSMWDNTSWKIKSTSKGYYFSPSAVTNNDPPDTKLNTSAAQWGSLTVDPLGFLNMDVYESDANGACVLIETLILSYRAGSGFGFVAGFETSSEASVKRGILNITGKSNDEGTGVLSGKVQSLGAYFEATYFQEENDFAASGVTIKGKLVKQLGCTKP
jgi:hypothetical protein